MATRMQNSALVTPIPHDFHCIAKKNNNEFNRVRFLMPRYWCSFYEPKLFWPHFFSLSLMWCGAIVGTYTCDKATKNFTDWNGKPFNHWWYVCVVSGHRYQAHIFQNLRCQPKSRHIDKIVKSVFFSCVERSICAKKNISGLQIEIQKF